MKSILENKEKMKILIVSVSCALTTKKVDKDDHDYCGWYLESLVDDWFADLNVHYFILCVTSFQWLNMFSNLNQDQFFELFSCQILK